MSSNGDTDSVSQSNESSPVLSNRKKKISSLSLDVLRHNVRKLSGGSSASSDSSISTIQSSTHSSIHQFKITTFKSFTFCDHCTKFLWGPRKQGVKCSLCKIVAHHKCRDSVMQLCFRQKVTISSGIQSDCPKSLQAYTASDGVGANEFKEHLLCRTPSRKMTLRRMEQTSLPLDDCNTIMEVVSVDHRDSHFPTKDNPNGDKVLTEEDSEIKAPIPPNDNNIYPSLSPQETNSLDNGLSIVEDADLSQNAEGDFKTESSNNSNCDSAMEMDSVVLRKRSRKFSYSSEVTGRNNLSKRNSRLRSSTVSADTQRGSWPKLTKQTKLHVVHNHLFVAKHFNTPTFCSYCDKFMWGVVNKQGYICINCKLPVHKKCHIYLNRCSSQAVTSTCHYRISLDNFVVRSSDGSDLDTDGDDDDHDAIKPMLNIINDEINRKGNVSFDDIYQLEDDMLGIGQFGVVKQCSNKSTGNAYAVKIINKKRFWMQPRVLDSLNTEVNILKSVSHENIVSLVDFFDAPQTMHIVMEYIGGGDMLDYVMDHQKLSEAKALALFLQIFSAVEHLHSKCISHRDLKPENILMQRISLESTGAERLYRAKIADFGFAAAANLMHTVCGTPAYLAPEVLANHGKEGKVGYGRGIDVWSCGVMLYSTLSGKLPFEEGIGIAEQVTQEGFLEFPAEDWENLSFEVIDLICRMLIADPHKRITATQCSKHPWILRKSMLNYSEESLI